MIASVRGKKPHVYRVIILKQMADHMTGIIRMTGITGMTRITVITGITGMIAMLREIGMTRRE